MVEAKELSKTTKVEETIIAAIEKDISTGKPDSGNHTKKKVEEEAKKEEEVIIFSDNHSLDDYIVGS